SVRNRPSVFRVVNLAITRLKVCFIRRPALGRHLNQHPARAYRDRPKLRSHVRRRPAAECAHVVRRQLGIAHQHVNRRERYPKLLGNLLRKRRAHILANFNFAGEYSYLTVLVDMQPGIEALRYLMLMVTRAARFLSNYAPCDRSDEQSSTQQFKKIAPIQIKRMPQSRDL